jgi:hypothetical protein
VECLLCRDHGVPERLFVHLGQHLAKVHSLTRKDYQRQHPGAPMASENLRAHMRDLAIDQGRQLWTREKAITALRADARRMGRVPGFRDWQRLGATARRPSWGTAVRLFGSWNAFVEAAGFPTRAPGGPRKSCDQAELAA